MIQILVDLYILKNCLKDLNFDERVLLNDPQSSAQFTGRQLKLGILSYIYRVKILPDEKVEKLFWSQPSNRAMFSEQPVYSSFFFSIYSSYLYICIYLYIYIYTHLRRRNNEYQRIGQIVSRIALRTSISLLKYSIFSLKPKKLFDLLSLFLSFSKKDTKLSQISRFKPEH